MKSIFKVVCAVLLVSFMFYTRVLAFDSGGNKSDIVIDGSFEDWKGKPYVEDSNRDIKMPWLDFTGLGYFTDDKYLYLHVVRQAAKKSEPWNFEVVVLNGSKGKMYLQYPFGSSNAVSAPQFDVSVSYDGNRSRNGILVKVSFDGQKLESTFSADNDAKEIEFRIPLNYVGLDGVNKEVKFALKFYADGIAYWMPKGTITVTNGPTLWKVSYIIFFIAASTSAYEIHKRRKIKEDFS